ncbi:MAG: DNA double-strand break repair nuclease NurA [Chloroflexi bacterium]|nr:DNA double-strand break repair nuclease NurA [Chloroflexota bacterium]
MTLDMLALGGQIRSMSGALRDELTALPDRIARARALLAEEAAEWEYWRDLVEEQSGTAAWLTAQPLDRYDAAYDLPDCPASYVVAASDGSQLDIDHHGVAACYVINIGTAVLQYGPDACFRAQSQPTLGYRDEDLVIRDALTGREYPKEGPVLAAQRDVDEGLRLAALATELPDDRPRLALQDGTLIRWSFTDLDPGLRRILVGDYLSYLGMMQELKCPVGSYLSRPRSREVIGLVKLMQAKGNFSRWRSDYPERRDDPYRAIVDTMLFAHLGEGQRSARWGSMSRINVEFYEENRIQFFYLRVGRELARVEFPAWVAEQGHLDLLHAVVYDQCRRGLGYPNVLARAHEQAVIHGDERRQITALIERLLIQAQVTPERSAKATSKLRPGA